MASNSGSECLMGNKHVQHNQLMIVIVTMACTDTIQTNQSSPMLELSVSLQ